jgi:hypothetical protein
MREAARLHAPLHAFTLTCFLRLGRWPGTDANVGFDQTRGCPVVGARVCAVSGVDNSTVSCAESDLDGSFTLSVGTGSYVRLTAQWNNHTFVITMPPNIEVSGAMMAASARRAWLHGPMYLA